MYKQVAIRRIGNATGMTIPKKMLQRHNLAEGDKVFIVETELGLLITPFDPDFAQAMQLYQEGNKAYRNAARHAGGDPDGVGLEEPDALAPSQSRSYGPHPWSVRNIQYLIHWMLDRGL